MFDIWQPVDSDLVAQIAAFQTQHCFEHIEASKVTADESNVCPFPGYHFVRLTFAAQRVRVNPSGEQDRRHELTDGTISYVLIRIAGDGQLVEVIPLHPNSENLYAINKRLGLKLTLETVVPYLVFFGLVVTGDEGSFYFVTNLNHIRTIRDQLPEDARQILDGMIHASFQVGGGGELVHEIKQKTYPILGNAFILTVPVIYAGGAYKAEVRISESGMPAMDNDEPTNIRSLDDRLPVAKRYSLQFVPDIAVTIGRTKRVLQSKIRIINETFGLERVISILLLPAYLMSLAIAFYLGIDNQAAYQYYEDLKSLRLLNGINLIVGTLLLFVVIMRFVVMEVAAITSKLVPNNLSNYFDTTTRLLREQHEKLGGVRFMALAAFEFMAAACLALNLFLYGLSNTIHLPTVSGGMNFIETFMLIVLSVPMIGPSLGWIFEIGDTVGRYHVYRDGFSMYLSSVVISTITFGWLIRLFRMGQSSD